MGAALLAVAAALVGAASAVTPSLADQAPARVITVDTGSQKLIREPRPLRRIAIGDPAVADVNLINGRELLVSGKAAGSTSLMLWPAGAKAPEQYRVEVSNPGVIGSQPDLMTHRGAVLGVRAATAAAAPGGTAVGVIDRSSVALDTQVMSQVKVVEVERTALQQYGINFLHFGSHGAIGATTPTTNSGFAGTGVPTGGPLTSTALSSATGFLPIQNAFNFLYAENNYLGALSVLEQKGLARTLAEPSLTAMSGQTASFLAGGEFPFPTVQNGGGGNNSITIVFKEFGIRLNLTPTVLARNRIALKVAPEVSELNFNDGITLNGITIPGLDVRRTDTMVELGDGESFVISGLVSNTLKNNVDKVPWLGDVPVLGAFFRDTSISRQQKELIMVVTPHLVRPLARGTAQPSLPGAATDQYNPDFAHTMFFENGDFGQTDHGYSR